MRSSEVSEKTYFLAFLIKCENEVTLLHYNNQATAAVDYIMFNFDNFSISNFVWRQVLLKKAAMYGVKKSNFCSGTDQRNKYICYEKFVFIYLVRKPM
jgi:hypothetical protein